MKTPHDDIIYQPTHIQILVHRIQPRHYYTLPPGKLNIPRLWEIDHDICIVRPHVAPTILRFPPSIIFRFTAKFTHRVPRPVVNYRARRHTIPSIVINNRANNADRSTPQIHPDWHILIPYNNRGVNNALYPNPTLFSVFRGVF